MVKEGRFREDLYYRLNVFSVNIPPLRERKKDIPILAEYFLKKFCATMNKNLRKISDKAMEFLCEYSWPGNVRELENAIERAVVVGRSSEILIEDLPFNKSNIEDKADSTVPLAEVEKNYIEKVLLSNNWNISRSADVLGIDRVTLYNKINKFGLKKI